MSAGTQVSWDEQPQIQWDEKKPTTADNEVERNAPKPYFGFAPGNLYEQGKRGIRELAGGVYGMGKDVLFPEGNTEGERLSWLAHKYVLDPADAENKKAQNASTPSESIGHSVAAAIPLVGPWAANLGEQAGTGDVGGAMARGGSQVGAAELATPIMRAAKVGAGMAREGAGNYIHDPVTGELTPGSKTIAQVGGGLTGAGAGIATGHGPYLGGVAGYTLGPSLMELMFPEGEARVAKRAEGEAYEGKAQDLMRREREQHAIHRREAQEAKTSIRDAAGKPGETVSVFPEPKPETEAARAGAMWSIPRKELRGAAMRGTPGAADVLQNTGRPVLFEPRGVIGASNPEFTALRESIPLGNPTPFQSIREVGASSLRPEVLAIATPSKAMQVPEWMAQERSYELQKAHDILRNPRATEEERAVAEARVRENR